MVIVFPEPLVLIPGPPSTLIIPAAGAADPTFSTNVVEPPPPATLIIPAWLMYHLVHRELLHKRFLTQARRRIRHTPACLFERTNQPSYLPGWLLGRRERRTQPECNR